MQGEFNQKYRYFLTLSPFLLRLFVIVGLAVIVRGVQEEVVVGEVGGGRGEVKLGGGGGEREEVLMWKCGNGTEVVFESG